MCSMYASFWLTCHMCVCGDVVHPIEQGGAVAVAVFANCVQFDISHKNECILFRVPNK